MYFVEIVEARGNENSGETKNDGKESGNLVPREEEERPWERGWESGGNRVKEGAVA